ncbi:MAG TPA: hypothetical protein VFI29_12290 [Hanamia sp.]|nr:hypothetical protein [Hanamia sp.]
MKFFFVIFLMSGFSIMKSNAQIIKKLGKKIEQKAEQRADRKVDKTIDKALDATENEADKSLKAAQEKKENEANAKAEANNSKSTSVATSQVPTTANLADGLVMVGGDCTDFIWFKEGSMMKFEVQDGKGKSVNQSQMIIDKVYKQDAVTIADVNMTDNEKNEFTMQFKCAGDKLYIDFASAIEQMMAKTNPENKEAARQASENVEMGFSDGFMSFPKNMYPGQTLDDAVFTMKTKSGNVGMDVTTSLTGRKVVAKEKITTPAGTFDCVKVIGNRTTTMNLLGKERNMGKPTQEHVWISPGIGTIKQENYTEKGKLESMSHLIEFKM